jgi:hypothetical protein
VCKRRAIALESPYILGSGFQWSRMSFFRLSLFITVSSFIIGYTCSSNVTSVSPVTLFFSFISLFHLSKYSMVFIVIVILDSDILVLMSFFFYWSFICFQFNPWCLICIYKVFRLNISTFNFLIFFLCSFVKKFMAFNFILKSSL